MAFVVSLLRRVGKFVSSAYGLVFGKINGSNRMITFGEVYRKYSEMHLPTLSLGTRTKLQERCERSLKPLFGVRVAKLDPEYIAGFINELKNGYRPGPFSKRFSYAKELKDLQTILQWYRDHFDFAFQMPVRKFHKALTVIERIPEKERLISAEETLKFIECLDDPLYKDFATIQLFAAGRVGEIAGIQVKNVDLEQKRIAIKEVISWVKGAPTVKNCPKNGHVRYVYINDTMEEIIRRRLATLPKGCVFLFNDGKTTQGLRFNRINAAYNRAWRKAELAHKFSGTHLLRFSGAQRALEALGTIDAAKAVTGHHSRMVEHYARRDDAELNRGAVTGMEKGLQEVARNTAKRQVPMRER